MTNNKQSFAIGLFSGIIIIVAIIFGYDFFIGYKAAVDPLDISPSSIIAKNKVSEIEKLINQRFWHEFENADLTDGMYAGLVDGLGDKYSAYYTKEEFEKMIESLNGHYQGIGVILMMAKDSTDVVVGHIYENSPAAQAGVAVGDIIIAIDEIELTDETLEAVAEKIRGSKDDIVTLTLIREGEEEPQEIAVEKGDVEMVTVMSEMLEDDIGYISIMQFTDTTAGQFEEAYQELKEAGMKGLLVDVRNNPGGSLPGVCDTLQVFMPAGLLVYSEDRQGDQLNFESQGLNPIEIPLVVLINENSASAAEIFAAAVQDHQVGTLVGQTTFGKGVVQSIFNLTDGSAVKLTTSAYFTPNGIDINGKGISPDVEVENIVPEEVDGSEELSDTQLDEAIELLKNM